MKLFPLLLALPAVLLTVGVLPQTTLAMAEKTPMSLTDEDTFVLHKSGNVFEMREKFGKLIEKYQTPKEVDKIIRRDNPEVKTKVVENYGPEKVNVYHYVVSRSRVLYKENFIATFSEKDGKIVNYGCNRGNR